MTITLYTYANSTELGSVAIDSYKSVLVNE